MYDRYYLPRMDSITCAYVYYLTGHFASSCAPPQPIDKPSSGGPRTPQADLFDGSLFAIKCLCFLLYICRSYVQQCKR